MPFHGIHDHTLDAKNRLTVPSKARAQLADGVTISQGLDTCLQVWPSDDHNSLVTKSTAHLNPLGDEARELNRFFYGLTTQLDLDSAGRISLTPEQLAYAGISKAVKVVGSGAYLELWDEETWQQTNGDLPARAAERIKSIGHPA